jgi:hypothetical protein
VSKLVDFHVPKRKRFLRPYTREKLSTPSINSEKSLKNYIY